MEKCSTPSWFAVQTKPRQELRAVENLQRQNFEVYFPRILIRKRRRDNWVSVAEPLFPGYLFICVDPEIVNLGVIRSTLGVRGLVMFGHCLKSIPAEAIHFLKSRETQGAGCLKADDIGFAHGDEVEILDGPFAGLTAVFDMRKPGDRVILLMQMLGKENRLTFHVDQISPLG
ncbi:MAG: hypothetical protein M0Q95_14505 [Porticoccaceae bacterium]|nr:hypothetical protein [Porticoccaceae bacterium]